MRNPFTLLKSAVSRFFAKPAPAPVHVPIRRERELSEIERENPPRHAFPISHPMPTGMSAALEEPGYHATQRARNKRRKDRAQVRAFVRSLSQGRG